MKPTFIEATTIPDAWFETNGRKWDFVGSENSRKRKDGDDSRAGRLRKNRRIATKKEGRKKIRTYRKEYYALIKGLFSALHQLEPLLYTSEYDSLLDCLQEIVTDNRWRLSISKNNPSRVTYCCDPRKKYSQRTITTFGRFIKRKLENKPFDHLVAMLWDCFMGPCDACYEIVSGNEIVGLYAIGYGDGSCMTGEHAESVRFYSENPQSVSLLKYHDARGHQARALIWRTTSGVRILDKIYASSLLLTEQISSWAEEYGLVIWSDLNFHPAYEVEMKRPSNGYMPYMDTFCNLVHVDEDGYTLSNRVDNVIHTFQHVDGEDYSIYGCCHNCDCPIYTEDDATCVGDHMYCYECFDEIFVTCGICERPIFRQDARMYNEIVYCSSCYNDEFTDCPRCWETNYRGDMKSVHTIDGAVCIDCRDRDFESCFFYCYDWYPIAPHAGAWIETVDALQSNGVLIIAPRAGAWIETGQSRFDEFWGLIAPSAGAWIETDRRRVQRTRPRSPLAQGRGLKPASLRSAGFRHKIAPRAGAWIENSLVRFDCADYTIAPHAGAWIEIRIRFRSMRCEGSPLAQRHGLKLNLGRSIWFQQYRPSRRGVD